MHLTSQAGEAPGSDAPLTLTAGSGAAWRGNGSAGWIAGDGIVFSIDTQSSSPYSKATLLDFTPRNVTGGDRWDDTRIPSGEHTVTWSAMSERVNADFTGFSVGVNGSVPR